MAAFILAFVLGAHPVCRAGGNSQLVRSLSGLRSMSQWGSRAEVIGSWGRRQLFPNQRTWRFGVRFVRQGP